MTSDPLVSVIVPTYNRPERLKRALHSVEAQTYNNIELIVVDDNSETSVEPILDGLSFKSDIIYKKHDQNKGANAARNTGIKAAGGKYISFLDDDDTWKKDKLEKQIKLIQSKNVGVVYAGIRHYDSGGDIIYESIPKRDTVTTEDLLRRNIVGSFSVVLVESNLIERAGLPDEKLPIWQDKDWYVRLSKHCQFGYVPEILVNRHMEEERISDNFDGLECETLPRFTDKYRVEINSANFVKTRLIYSEIFYNVSRYALFTHNYEKSREYSLKSLFYNPLNYKAIGCHVLSVNSGFLFSFYDKYLSS